MSTLEIILTVVAAWLTLANFVYAQIAKRQVRLIKEILKAKILIDNGKEEDNKSSEMGDSSTQ